MKLNLLFFSLIFLVDINAQVKLPVETKDVIAIAKAIETPNSAQRKQAIKLLNSYPALDDTIVFDGSLAYLYSKRRLAFAINNSYIDDSNDTIPTAVLHTLVSGEFNGLRYIILKDESKLRVTESYVNGKLQGSLTVYDSEGNISDRIEFQDDKLITRVEKIDDYTWKLNPFEVSEIKSQMKKIRRNSAKASYAGNGGFASGGVYSDGSVMFEEVTVSESHRLPGDATLTIKKNPKEDKIIEEILSVSFYYLPDNSLCSLKMYIDAKGNVEYKITLMSGRLYGVYNLTSGKKRDSDSHTLWMKFIEKNGFEDVKKEVAKVASKN